MINIINKFASRKFLEMIGIFSEVNINHVWLLLVHVRPSHKTVYKPLNLR